ncbi:hypothetical protein T01_2940 [Trichinella spiralis]|uniref:Uncharacterized protein n=1 Tax=Trichinella spiralis TaxID=6334 RepID=A0A0V1B8U8_TRISP|nr:hypothetical protein T01_2940 [Trichinella spiralis]
MNNNNNPYLLITYVIYGSKREIIDMKRQQLKDTDYPSHIYFSFTQRLHLLFLIKNEISSIEAQENRISFILVNNENFDHKEEKIDKMAGCFDSVWCSAQLYIILEQVSHQNNEGESGAGGKQPETCTLLVSLNQ